MDTDSRYSPPLSNEKPFEEDSWHGGYKTVISGGLMVVANALKVFGVWDVTPEQLMAINGVLLGLVGIFLRMGVMKAQKAAEASPKPRQE